MSFELLLLCSLIFVFIVSFCGLLQKIKQSYERERAIADRMAQRHINQNRETSDSYVNGTFVEDIESGPGIFPGAPPPYTHLEQPPKYEDIIKREHDIIIGVVPTAPADIARIHSAPPPYTPYTITA